MTGPTAPRPAASTLRLTLCLSAPAVVLLASPAALAAEPSPPTPRQAAPASGTAPCPASLDFRFPRLQDEVPQDLCQFAGKVVLVVNTASYCGFTPQYQGLEALYAQYRQRGLVVLGFPSNDFEQEPGSAKEIADFCFNTYGVKFPMMAKSHVRGAQANPMYALMARQTGTAPRWNFHKYLIDREGRVVASYDSRVAPDDRQLLGRIEQLLGAAPSATAPSKRTEGAGR